MRNPYFIDTVYYHGFSERTLRIMNMSRRRSLISPGEQFNVTDLDGERTRISTLLRNVGCYYFRPDYLTYQADTTLVPGGHVAMRMVPAPGMRFRCRAVLCRQESFLSVWQAGTDP